MADALFNLQTVGGFAERLRRYQTWGPEAILAELDAASMLFRSAISFRFVVERGVKGADYDFDITIGSNSIAAEVEAKIESTDLRPQTIRATLRRAVNQLPRDRAGAIFLKIPDPWVSQTTVGNAIDDSLNWLARQSKRVSAVYVYWHVWQSASFPGAARILLSRKWTNPNARVELSVANELAKHPGAASGWRYIHSIVNAPSQTDERSDLE